MLSEARQVIKKVLAKAQNPAVLFSGGKDSSLLFHLAREIKPNIPCVWFRSGDERFVKRMILELDLEVWSWAPRDVYVLPNEGGLSLVKEQSFGTHTFPVISDIEHGPGCIEDYPSERTPLLYPHFDVLLIGYKESDYHWTLGGSGFCPEDGWQLGQARVFAPLRKLTDERVWAAIKELGVPYDVERYENGGPDPSDYKACTACLQEGAGEVWCQKEERYIPRVQWQPQERLKEFRQKFGFKEAA